MIYGFHYAKFKDNNLAISTILTFTKNTIDNTDIQWFYCPRYMSDFEFICAHNLGSYQWFCEKEGCIESNVMFQ